MGPVTWPKQIGCFNIAAPPLNRKNVERTALPSRNPYRQKWLDRATAAMVDQMIQGQLGSLTHSTPSAPSWEAKHEVRTASLADMAET